MHSSVVFILSLIFANTFAQTYSSCVKLSDYAHSHSHSHKKRDGGEEETMAIYVYWNYVASTSTLEVKVTSEQATGWFGVGFYNGTCEMETGQDCMSGADYVIGVLSTSSVDSYTRARGLGNGQPVLSANQALVGTSIGSVNGALEMTFTRPFYSGNFPITESTQTLLFAWGTGTFSFHGENHGVYDATWTKAEVCGANSLGISFAIISLILAFF